MFPLSCLPLLRKAMGFTFSRGRLYYTEGEEKQMFCGCEKSSKLLGRVFCRNQINRDSDSFLFAYSNQLRQTMAGERIKTNDVKKKEEKKSFPVFM